MKVYSQASLLEKRGRVVIDNATFTFGKYNADGHHFNGFLIMSAGLGDSYIDKFIELTKKDLEIFIKSLLNLENNSFRQKIKFKIGWSNINFHFKDVLENSDVKVRTYLSSILFFSSSFSSSEISRSG